MDAWLIWIIVACVFAVGEMLTLSFFLAPFAGGSLLAGIAALAGAPTAVSWALFLIVSLLLLLVVRPIAKSHARKPPRIRTGTDALLGRSGIVVERIANAQAVGAVKIEGEVWTARAFDETRVYEVGDNVEIIEIRGVTAVVDD